MFSDRTISDETYDVSQNCLVRRRNESPLARRGASGHVCAVDFAVFRRRAHDSNEYVAEEPEVTMVRLPIGEQVGKKALDIHDYTDSDCAAGLPFSAAIKPVVSLLQQRSEIVCHKLVHETLVMCRERQKLYPPSGKLLEALYSGHCTSIMAKIRNNGFNRRLSDEFRSFVGQESVALRRHNPGHDAAMSARLFLLRCISIP